MNQCPICKMPFVPARKKQVFCSKSCASVPKGAMRKGIKTGPREGWMYKKQIDKDGYVRRYARLHPFCDGRLMIQEHVMVMENHIGRRLQSDEVVHHKNGNRQDNRLPNLQLMTRSEHSLMHGPTPRRERDALGRFT